MVKPMNPPRLNPNLVLSVRKQVKDWNKELAEPWHPSHAAKLVAQGLRNSCPKMAKALETAEILEPFAEMLLDRVDALKMENRKAGMEAAEAENEARKELIPSSQEMEAEWLEANSLPTRPDAKATV